MPAGLNRLGTSEGLFQNASRANVAIVPESDQLTQRWSLWRRRRSSLLSRCLGFLTQS